MQRRPSGFSLVESLVAMAVFLIGSACTATWLVWSMGIDARASRSIAATVAAQNLAVRMRANPDGRVAGHYARALSHQVSCLHGCDALSLAADDLRRFRTSLSLWMGAAAEGSVVCQVPHDCVIHITWQGRDELAWPVPR